MLQIEISKTYGVTEWHDDLRKVLKMTGEANKKVSGTRLSEGVSAIALRLIGCLQIHRLLTLSDTLLATLDGTVDVPCQRCTHVTGHTLAGSCVDVLLWLCDAFSCCSAQRERRALTTSHVCCPAGGVPFQ